MARRILPSPGWEKGIAGEGPGVRAAYEKSPFRGFFR
jgi:hypothetical protein